MPKHEALDSTSASAFRNVVPDDGSSQNSLQINGDTEFEILPAQDLNATYIYENDIDWESGLDPHHVAFITGSDITWLFDDTSMAQFDSTSSQYCPPGQLESSILSNDLVTDSSDLDEYSHYSPPLSPSDTVQDPPRDISAPSCGYRICNALTEAHREELLATLQLEMTDVDFDHPTFSLNIMKQGVHLYARNTSKEYAIFHHHIFAPSGEEEKTEIRDHYGEEAPLQLTWAIITLGWALMDTQTEHEKQISSQIQGVLRKFVLTVCASWLYYDQVL